MGIPGMPDYIQKKLHDQTVVFMYILLQVKSEFSTSKQIVFDLSKFKKNMQSDPNHFQLQLKN